MYEFAQANHLPFYLSPTNVRDAVEQQKLVPLTGDATYELTRGVGYSYATPEARGAAIGVNSSAQFLGAFAGAAIGGWLAEHTGDVYVFEFCIALVALWLGATATMARPAGYVMNYSMGER